MLVSIRQLPAAASVLRFLLFCEAMCFAHADEVPSDNSTIFLCYI